VNSVANAVLRLIEPIDSQRRVQVVHATEVCLARAEVLFGRRFPVIPISFDLRGRSAGMYRVRGGVRCIRYNPYIFAKYFADGLSQTVPHEVAHYVTDLLYGLRRVRPHGREWQAVMRRLGAEPRATGRYDLAGIPLRRQRCVVYRCACTEHQLGTRRHRAVSRGEARYVCRRCKSELRLAGPSQRGVADSTVNGGE